VTNAGISVEAAMQLLETNCAESDHVFWPHQQPVTKLLPEIRQRVQGHQQLSDAILLDLAIRNGGRLATLNRRVAALLAQNSAERGAIEIVPAGPA
jgi:predicted nucleic acid-binding protein